MIVSVDRPGYYALEDNDFIGRDTVFFDNRIPGTENPSPAEPAERGYTWEECRRLVWGNIESRWRPFVTPAGYANRRQGRYDPTQEPRLRPEIPLIAVPPNLNYDPWLFHPPPTPKLEMNKAFSAPLPLP